jgi:hypothetical protein
MPVTAFWENAMESLARTRARALVILTALVGTVVFLASGCTVDAPSAPTPPRTISAEQPSSSLLGIDGELSGVLDLSDTTSQPGELLSGTLSGVGLGLYRCETPAFGSVSQVVGPEGGVIKIGPHSLHIPENSLKTSVLITASAPAGQHVKVDFQPEGLKFGKRAVLRLSYAHCPSRPLRPKLAYVNDLLSILELLPSADDLANEQVTGRLKHFSGYAIAD